MTNRFLIGLMALAFCFIIALPAYAQDALTPEKKALIKELMRHMNATVNSEDSANQMMEQMMEGMREPLVALFLQGLQQEAEAQKMPMAEQRRLKSEAEEAALRIMARARAEFPKRINLDELDRVVMEMYGKRFTDEELMELVTFYKSPKAQKLVRLAPEINAETLPKIQEWTPTLTQLVGELVREEKKRLKIR